MSTVKVQKGQGLFDVALQNYGSLEYAYQLLRLNNGLTFDTLLTPLQVLKVDDLKFGAIKAKKIVNFINENNLKYNNSIDLIEGLQYELQFELG